MYGVLLLTIKNERNSEKIILNPEEFNFAFIKHKMNSEKSFLIPKNSLLFLISGENVEKIVGNVKLSWYSQSILLHYIPVIVSY